MVVTETILKKVIGDNDGARELCLLLMLGEYSDDIEELCFYGITEKRAANLYYVTNGDMDLVHQSIKFISSEIISLSAIHKRLDADEPQPIINRKIKPKEEYYEFFESQVNECWETKKTDSKKR